MYHLINQILSLLLQLVNTDSAPIELFWIDESSGKGD
jgi:hypothetical protein